MNWTKVIEELLNEYGMKAADIHRETGLSKSMISRLQNGVMEQPRFDDGVKLMKLYSRKTYGG